MKKSYKILLGVLIILAIYNPNSKDFASQHNYKGRHMFTSLNFIVCSVYIRTYHEYGFDKKYYTLGILGNLIDLN
jgi:hypothetical protein